jgi:membrane associated rhomboid family serine protease
MLIPYNTDAPIYYWPYATLGTIILNVVIFFQMLVMPEERQELIYEHLILHYGTWNPIQWLTSNYLHAGFLHVLGNMIVLWGIGIIIEGKVGWWAFLLIYNGLGVFQCGIEQTLMLFAEGGSLGASAIVYGLIAMAMVWAPRNELNCILLIGWRSISIDLPVSGYAGFSLAVEVLIGILTISVASTMGTFVVMTSQALHLMGAASGFGLAVLMLKLKWVDCENWDLFSVMQGKHSRTREQEAEDALNSEEGKAKLASHFEQMHVQFRNYLAADEAAAALSVHRRGKIQFGPNWQLSEEEHIHLIGGLRKAHRWDDAVLIMTEYLKTHTQRANLVRLALAQLLVEQLSRPRQALKVLAKLDRKSLPPAQQGVLAKLTERAQREAEENPFEAVQDEV